MANRIGLIILFLLAYGCGLAVLMVGYSWLQAGSVSERQSVFPDSGVDLAGLSLPESQIPLVKAVAPVSCPAWMVPIVPSLFCLVD